MESDELAYSIPSTEKTRIFVSVGSLDVKTPLLEARRFLARIRAPSKHLFELKNVAHSTDPCRAEIVHAMIADGVKEQIATLAAAEECADACPGARALLRARGRSQQRGCERGGRGGEEHARAHTHTHNSGCTRLHKVVCDALELGFGFGAPQRQVQQSDVACPCVGRRSLVAGGCVDGCVGCWRMRRWMH